MVSPTAGTVFHPPGWQHLWIGTVFHPPFPVDRHGVSPTAGTVFHPPQPPANPATARVCKTVTRARVFLTIKVFNALLPEAGVDNSNLSTSTFFFQPPRYARGHHGALRLVDPSPQGGLLPPSPPSAALRSRTRPPWGLRPPRLRRGSPAWLSRRRGFASMPLLHAVAAYNGKTRLRTYFAIDCVFQPIVDGISG